MLEQVYTNNAIDIENELKWFSEILGAAISLNCGKECDYKSIFEIEPPNLEDSPSIFAKFVNSYQLDFHERFLLILALVPQIKPELLDVFMIRNSTTNQIHTEFGGRTTQNFSGFLPTGETYMYLLAGSDLKQRFYLRKIFGHDHVFIKEKIIWLHDIEPGASPLKGTIIIAQEMVEYLTTGEVQLPAFSSSFPAKRLTTKMDWDDIVLPDTTMSQLEDIQIWLKYHDALMKDWDMDKKIKPGYRTLFYGPPGTGKSLTASLLAKKNNLEVYRVDLSKVVSKFIGETEKNLSQIFDKAENKNWILFFDEADALFGKRTNVNDAHDRYANQEVSYLLQRIEDYDGLVVLASNFKENIDEAFLRRFHSIIYFPIPKAAERAKLWAKSFSKNALFEEKLQLQKVADEHELAGGSIINVVQYSSLMALSRQSNTILLKDINEGIRREFSKSGRSI